MLPAINRIAPELAGGAEVVRRNAGDDARLAILLKFEQLAIAPHVGAVESDIDRQVAHDANVVAGAMRLQVAPLAFEFKLDELVALDVVAQLLARAVHGGRLAQRQLALPLHPARPDRARP